MALVPSVLDKFMKVGIPGTATTLSAPGYTAGTSTSINVPTLTNWPTDTLVPFAMDRAQVINGVETRIAGTYCEFTGIVSSATTISNIVKTVGNTQSYAAGTLTRVYIPVTSTQANSMVDGIRLQHKGDGTHDVVTATSISAPTGNITALTVGTLTVGSQSAPADWTPIGVTPTVTASNGQKEYTLQYAGTDLTGVLQKGSKLRIPRSVTPPTQAMSFTAASSQYASKASPTGITFTSAFTVEAWVYVNSYAGMMIISRTDASAANGWFFKMNASGQIEVDYASGSNTTAIQTYQSLPIKQWVHVAVVVTSISGKTGAIYFNGAAVPVAIISSAATTLTQSGSLMLGTYGSPSGQYFDGYISEARVWSVGQTQTQINNNMGISLVGTETNLVALFQGNGNFNDKTGNANNLTASGGAVATQLSNPYSAIEYGIVTNVAYTGGNTVATVFSGTASTIPNAALSATSYSGQRAPFGFPSARSKWAVTEIRRVLDQQVGATMNTWYNLGINQLMIPTGEWVATWNVAVGGSGASAVNTYTTATLSTTNNSETNVELSAAFDALNVAQAIGSIGKSGGITNTASTTWYLNTRSTTRNGDPIYNDNSTVPGIVTAECAYL